MPPWLLGPDGRAFVLDETRATIDGVPDSGGSRAGHPIFDTIETAVRARGLSNTERANSRATKRRLPKCE